MQNGIETIAAWCAAAPPFSSEARHRAGQAVVDTIGCMIAGIEDFSTRAVRQAFADQLGPAGAATVIGGGRSSAPIAALVNGTAAHALDYDDNFHGATTHASAVLVPALAAVAERSDADGQRFVTAYLVGLEAQAAVGRGVNPSHYTAGWHSTATVGCIGTAAGVAWLMGLDAPGIARAMSIAVSMASGVKGQFGTPVKPVHAGLAARNAVEAAAMAAAGMTGRLDVLESAQGFLGLYGGLYPAGWAELTFGPVSIIESIGLATKLYPCCGSTHRVIDSVLELKRQHGFGAGDVARVDVLVGIAAARNLPYSAPDNEMQARFSMPYCVALALVQDRLSLKDFTPEAVRRPELTVLLPLTTMRTYDEATERETSGRLPHQVAVILKDGMRLAMTKRAAKGTIAEPLDDLDRIEKFIDCTAGILPALRAEALFQELQTLDQMPRLAFLGDGTLSPARRNPMQE